jgi:hypothetical protein
LDWQYAFSLRRSGGWLKVLKKVFSLFIFLFLPEVSAQELITDRPDQTESAVTVPLGSLQIETGFVYESFHENSFDYENYSIAGTLFRYGLFENIELRFGTAYLINKAGVTNKGLGDFLLGTKINFIKEESGLFDFGMLIHAALPVGAEAFKPGYIEPELIASFSKTLSDRFSMGFNAGGSLNSATDELIYIYTGTVGIYLTDELSAFLELYASFSTKIFPEHYFDGGFTYLLSENFQLDISGGKGISGIENLWFISSGISFRLLNE